MRIGFIGAGQMATALATGIAKNFDTASIFSFDPLPSALDSFAVALDAHGVSLQKCSNNQAVVDQASTVFVAVKPQLIQAALADIQIADDTVVVSVVAGTKIETLAKLTNTDRIIRSMPNTPCLIGRGAIAICRSESVDQSSFEIVKSIFDKTGIAVELPERLLDAVTGLSGSGPAFVYTFLESLIEAGVLGGLPREVSRTLAIQTVLGSTEMLQQTDLHPAVLRDRVTSPGGTTIHGLEQLEQLGFRQSVISAVQAATNRSRELA